MEEKTLELAKPENIDIKVENEGRKAENQVIKTEIEMAKAENAVRKAGSEGATENKMTINALPAKTWRRLRINDTTLSWTSEKSAPMVIELEDGRTSAERSGCDTAGVDVTCGDVADVGVTRGGAAGADVTCDGVTGADVPQDDATYVDTDCAGMVDANRNATASVYDGARTVCLGAAAGEQVCEKLRVTGTKEQYCAGSLVLRARENSSLTVWTDVNSDALQKLALRLQLHAERNAKICLVQLLWPGREGTVLNEITGSCAENAQIEVMQLFLGYGDVYDSCQVELNGDRSHFSYRSGYLEQRAQKLDVNVVADHFGKDTTSQIRTDGTLKGEAHKTFRGTIDFKRGAAGSIGREEENVLLLGEKIVNQTAPLILCAEESVQGSHGATIGELDEETLFYFAARGIDARTAENILTRGKLEQLCAKMSRKIDGEADRATTDVANSVAAGGLTDTVDCVAVGATGDEATGEKLQKSGTLSVNKADVAVNVIDSSTENTGTVESLLRDRIEEVLADGRE